VTKPIDDGLTQLADAAFEQAARKVIERAEESGTPVIVCVNQQVKAMQPRVFRNGIRHARQAQRRGVTSRPAKDM
jgi:hypothetical protein